jgi:LuxR family transcriptional regulator, maltose regulon positive regulatory protein
LHGLGNQEQTAPRVAWLSLEADDNDPYRFFTHFVAALQSLDPGAGQAARPFLETPQLPAFDHLMTLLLNDLASLSEQSVLALDDYHAIKQPDLQTAIVFFLDHLPPHCHLVIMTREEPSLPLPRLRVRWEVTEIRLQDLRFAGEETEAFLQRTLGFAVSTESAQALERRTEGWAAGLQMAALSLRGRVRMQGADATAMDVVAFGGGHHYIIDYLAAEVMRQQPEEVCAFLRQTAILDRFNASLCDAVTGRSDSQAMLAHLEKANLFLIPLDDQRQWYRYHHLFADFLRTELAEPERSALHRQASHWYEAHSLTSEAIKHALSGRDQASAVRLIRSNVDETLRNGGFTAVLNWVNALPEEIVRADSDLSVNKAWMLYLRGEIATAETYATLAIENQRPDDPPLQRGTLLGFRAYLAINRGEPTQAVKFAQEALTLLGDTESFYRTTALSHLGQAQRLVGARQAAMQTLRQAIALGQQLGNHLITLEALGILTRLLYQQGQLREAILLCEQTVRHHMDARGHPLPMAGLIYVPMGMLYYETNDLERAYHHLTTGIALCQHMGTVYYALVGQQTLAKLYYARGEIEAMWETLATARELAARSENQRRIRLISAVTADLQLRQGHTVAAALTLNDLPPTADDRSEQENLTFARLLLAQGRPQAAHSLLLQLEQFAQGQGRHGSLIIIRLLQALAHQSLNQSAATLDCLEQALCLAAPEGYRRVFLDEGTAVATILSQRRVVAPEFIDALLEAFPKRPAGAKSIDATPGATTPAQPPIEPLSEIQLKILRLVADGLSNREIADRLAITEGTTKWRLNKIYGKLSVSSRTQAVALARQLMLL